MARIALAMAHAHLEAGHDVIVPQLLARRDFTDMLRAVTENIGAKFVEITLLDERQATLDVRRGVMSPQADSVRAH